jgi:hypothetical protein
MVSVRVPHALYAQAQEYAKQHRMSMTELLLDGLTLRLETPTDPREVLLSDSHTVIQELRAEMIAAAEHAAVVAVQSLLQTSLPSDNNHTVIQEHRAQGHPPLAPPRLRARRRDAISRKTLQAIATARRQHPKLTLKAFAQHLYTKGIYQAQSKDGGTVPPSVGFLHRWLGEAKKAGLL